MQFLFGADTCHRDCSTPLELRHSDPFTDGAAHR
jgi:hypothetical protein